MIFQIDKVALNYGMLVWLNFLNVLLHNENFEVPARLMANREGKLLYGLKIKRNPAGWKLLGLHLNGMWLWWRPLAPFFICNSILSFGLYLKGRII